MDDRRRLIAEMEERGKKNAELQAQAYGRLGKFTAESLGEMLPPGPAAEAVQEIRKTIKSMESNSGKIARIREIAARLEAIRREARVLDDEAGEIEKENLPIFEQFGRAAFQRTGREPVTAEESERIETIRNLQDEISAMDETVSSLKAPPRDKPLLTKLFDGGKIIFLSSSRSLKIRNMEKQFQDLGRVLLEKGGAPEDSGLLESYEANREKLGETRAKIEALKSEGNSLEAELLRLGVDARHQKRIKNLEIQNDGLNGKLTGQYIALGKEVHRTVPAVAEGNEDFRALAADIDLLQKRAEENSDELEKTRAAVLQDGLNRRLNDLRRRLEAEEEELRNRRERIESLKKEIEATRAEKKKLEEPSR